MQGRYFYKEIIEIEDLVIELEDLELSPTHKKHLSELIDQHIHHTVLDLILSKLSEEDKIKFLRRMQDDATDRGLLEFLNSKTENIEQEIKKSVRELKAQLHKDIKDAKRLHPKRGK